MKKCLRGTPIRIIVLAKGHIPEFYCIQSLSYKKNILNFLVNNRAEKSPNIELISNEYFDNISYYFIMYVLLKQIEINSYMWTVIINNKKHLGA